MFRKVIPAALLALATSAAFAQDVSFDSDWRFFKGEAANAQTPDFNDGPWRRVEVPHDWSIEGPYDEKAITLRGGGYLPAGIGWYRKTFSLPDDAKNKRVFVDFDGVMANSEVWINGKSVAKRPYGYSSFRADLTDALRPAGANVIAVRCDNSVQPASRAYTGAGIYRHTHLVIDDPVHIEHWATHVATPEVKGEQATVHVSTSVINESAAAADVALEISLTDPENKAVGKVTLPAQQIAAGKAATFEKDLYVDWPKMWDINSPVMYAAHVTVKSGASAAEEITPFGIRLLEWKPDTGFWLNGNNIKLLGVCLHHDGGAVGAAVPLSIWERRLTTLKAIGANAIRTAHNPADPAFLTLCDRMGMLVMEESFDTWTAAKPNGQQGYNRLFNQWFEADTRDMVLRDRNHPSIVMWSAGNEIRDNLASAGGRDHFIAQRDLYHTLDGTRPVTMALFRPNTMGVYDKGGFGELMDVVGQNYNETELVRAWQQDKSRKVIGTENRHDAGAWRVLRDNPFMAGQFLWTGIDYLGESDWPYVSRYTGLIDRTGAFHGRGYERQSWWSKKPVVAIVRQEGMIPTMGTLTSFPNMVHDWTPSDASAQATLEVYSNCDTVELFLNDRSLGSKPINADATARGWKIPFQAGTLKAVGKNKGEVAATDELKTAGKPVAVAAAADRAKITAGFDDVSIVEITVKDANGVANGRASDLVTFRITGPGKIIAVDNGDVADHASYQAMERKLHEGRAIAIVRANGAGTIGVTASVAGMKDATAKIEAVDVP